MISKIDIVRDLRRVYNQLAEEPTEEQYNEHGSYSSYTVRKRFGSIADAREAAGIAAGEKWAVDDEVLLADIRRVAKVVNGGPTQSDYREHGEFSYRVFYYRFDGWADAREKAGLEGPEQNQWIPDQDLISEIRRLAEDLAQCPTQTQIKEHSKYSHIVFRNRFGSWNAAVREAGFEPRARGAQPGEENPSWKGGSIESYYGSNWETQRQKCLQRDGYQCQHCSMSQEEHIETFGEELNIHHIINRREFLDDGEFDYKRANRIKNLVALCTKHHSVYDNIPGARPHNVPERTV